MRPKIQPDTDSLVLYQVQDQIGYLTLNRPGKRNALNLLLIEALLQSMVKASQDPDIHALCITGAGDKSFCAGLDLAGEFFQADPLVSHQAIGRYKELIETTFNFPCPVICRINGSCFGGGLGLVLASDLAIAADDAIFGTPEIKLGLFPMLIMALLIKNIGRKKALEMLFWGEPLSAQEALALGLINTVISRSDFDKKSLRLISQFSRYPNEILRAGKAAFIKIADQELFESLKDMQDRFARIAKTDLAQKGILQFLTRSKDPNG